MGVLGIRRARWCAPLSLGLLILPFLLSMVTVRAAGPLGFDPVFQPFANTLGQEIIGVPISPLIVRDGMRFQYTERSRLEMPVSGGGAQLTNAGTILSSGRFTPLDQSKASPDALYFPDTKHSLANGFHGYWDQHGGRAAFGAPISEEFLELNPADGKTYNVQYFERAKFEWHPESVGTPNEIQLGFLGKQLYQFIEGVRLPGATDPVPGLTTPGNPNFGIVTEFTNQTRPPLLRAISDLGMHWVRQPIQWFGLESSPGVYDFSGYDFVVNDLISQDVKVLFTVSGSPTWETPNGDHGAPRDPADFTRFMSAMATHFAGRVAAYEVWNEPNLALEWGPRVSAGAYAEMLKSVTPAIRAADPHAIVVAAALGPTGYNDPKIGIDDVHYLEQLEAYQNGVYRWVADVQGAHPYGYRNAPDMLPPDKPNTGAYTEHPSFYFRRIEQLRLAMIRGGDGDRAIWITEFGWGTGNFPEVSDVTEEMRGQWDAQAVQMIRTRYPWVGAMFIWNLNWSVFSPPDVSWGYFSLLNSDYSHRPAFDAVKYITKQTPTIALAGGQPTSSR